MLKMQPLGQWQTTSHPSYVNYANIMQPRTFPTMTNWPLVLGVVGIAAAAGLVLIKRHETGGKKAHKTERKEPEGISSDTSLNF